MNRARAEQISRLTFYKHIDNLSASLSRNCDNSEVAFDVGRYVGMMQSTLENELEEEIEVSNDEQSIWKDFGEIGRITK